MSARGTKDNAEKFSDKEIKLEEEAFDLGFFNPYKAKGQGLFKNDEELFAILREELFTAVIGYIMNKMDFLRQFLPLHHSNAWKKWQNIQKINHLTRKKLEDP